MTAPALAITRQDVRDRLNAARADLLETRALTTQWNAFILAGWARIDAIVEAGDERYHQNDATLTYRASVAGCNAAAIRARASTGAIDRYDSMRSAAIHRRAAQTIAIGWPMLPAWRYAPPQERANLRTQRAPTLIGEPAERALALLGHDPIHIALDTAMAAIRDIPSNVWFSNL
jgi:hypothetical protein